MPLRQKPQHYKDAMPTFIEMVVKLEEPSGFSSDEFRAVALFSGIGLVAALIAMICGTQGVWL